MKRWFIFFLLLSPSIVFAGKISLTTIISTDLMTEDTSQIKIIITNSGDEAAYNVKLSISSDDFKADSVDVGILQPDIPFETNIDVSKIKEINEGSYSLVLLTEYADANGYPFSSVSPVSLNYKKSSVSSVTASVGSVSLSGDESKDIVVTLTNTDDKTHDVKVKLSLPKELKTEEVQKTVTVGSKEKKTLNFKVSNLAGLSGSSYVILTSVEYEENDLHYSFLVDGMVSITQGTTKTTTRTSNVPKEFNIMYVLIFAYVVFMGGLVFYRVRRETLHKKSASQKVNPSCRT